MSHFASQGPCVFAAVPAAWPHRLTRTRPCGPHGVGFTLPRVRDTREREFAGRAAPPSLAAAAFRSLSLSRAPPARGACVLRADARPVYPKQTTAHTGYMPGTGAWPRGAPAWCAHGPRPPRRAADRPPPCPASRSQLRAPGAGRGLLAGPRPGPGRELALPSACWEARRAGCTRLLGARAEQEDPARDSSRPPLPSHLPLMHPHRPLSSRAGTFPHHGQVQEPHRPQPVVQGPPQRHQEAEAEQALFAQGGEFGEAGVRSTSPLSCTPSLTPPLSLSLSLSLSPQMDPKFLRNQRYAKHHNKVADKA